MIERGKSILLGVILVMVLPLLIYSQSETYTVLLKAEALQTEGAHSKSLTLLNEFLTSASDYRLFLARGDIYIETGNLLMAEADFKTASGLKGSSGAYGLARVNAIARDAEKSLSFLEENLKSDFRVSEREIMADAAFNGIENTSEWRKFWSIDRYTEAELLLSEVQYLVGIGKVEEAKKIVQDGKINYSPRPESVYSEALVNFAAGQYQAAASLLGSETSSGATGLRRDKLLGYVYYELGKYTEAISLMTNLINEEVPDAEIFMSRARCYEAISDYSKSLSDIDFYLSIYPTDETALNFAGTVCVKAGDNNGALRYLNVNLEANPNSIQAYRNRGEVWTSTRMWNYAVSDFSMALDLDPFDSELWLNKGVSLLNLGKREEACHDFRQSMRLGNRKASDYISKNCIR
jgi:tetratricopeptide (TPR) repeat protein